MEEGPGAGTGLNPVLAFVEHSFALISWVQTWWLAHLFGFVEHYFMTICELPIPNSSCMELHPSANATFRLLLGRPESTLCVPSLF